MAILTINDLPESRSLDHEAMKRVRGGYRTGYPMTALMPARGSDTGPGGPRPPEDQIRWPDNPFDIYDLIK